MDRHTRKELKTDKFAQGVGTGFEFVTHHRALMVRYGLIALAVVVVAAGIWTYRSHQATLRTDLLTKAMQIDEATVGAPQPPRMSFPTFEEKEKARIAAFTNVATQYPGSQEGAIAQLAVAAAQSDEGHLDDAIKTFKAVSDGAPAPYASVAQLSLAQIYESQGKTADAEKLLRQLIDNPTVFVSKDQATLELAQLLAQSNPAEARKLVAPLSASPRSAVSRAAVAVLGTIPNAPPAAQPN
ncbi:MAG TPA: tetratricopeptide repeat protein [Bryobacteraceae bacterium]|jgi:predicted negative regulator of RcsB-dependent stress response